MILHLLNRVSSPHADGNPGLPIRRKSNAAKLKTNVFGK